MITMFEASTPWRASSSAIDLALTTIVETACTLRKRDIQLSSSIPADDHEPRTDPILAGTPIRRPTSPAYGLSWTVHEWITWGLTRLNSRVREDPTGGPSARLGVFATLTPVSSSA